MSHISTFVSRRFEELHAILNASGYLLDFSGREHPRWEDDPLLGLIHMRAVLLPNADQDEDAEPNERITFTLLERWSEHPYLTRNSARASTYAATPTTDRPATPKARSQQAAQTQS